MIITSPKTQQQKQQQQQQQQQQQENAAQKHELRANTFTHATNSLTASIKMLGSASSDSLSLQV
jgi:hypothetical protein